MTTAVSLASHKNIAVIGAGPATVYLLAEICRDKKLFNHQLTIFESSGVIGRGTPYNSYSSQYKMLSNLHSEEVPELHVPFARWCEQNFITVPETIIPRYLLGQYLEAAFHHYCHCLEPNVQLVSRCEITRIEPTDSGAFLVYHHSQPAGEFDQIVINTGHGTINENALPSDEASACIAYLSTPYPLQRVLSTNISNIVIRGASLSAIDCALAVAQKKGYFETVRNRLRYTARTPLHLTMYSSTGRFPSPWFASLDLQSDIEARLSQMVGEASTICLQRLFKAGFIDFLAAYAPSVYQQVHSKNIEQTVAYLLSNRQKLSVETLLKVEFLGHLYDAVADPESQENWQGVLECFGNALHCYSHLLSQQDLRCYENVLKPFIAKANAALPTQSAAKIHALMQSGALTIKQCEISRENFEQLAFCAPEPVRHLYVDCTSGDNLGGCAAMIQPLIQAGILQQKPDSNANKPDLWVNKHFQAVAENGLAHIFIGAPSLLSSTLLTLPGLEVNDFLSTAIAQALGAQQSIAIDTMINATSSTQ
ncbi:FAD/NAD(P)-binding protein [Salinimonas marina]|uniref:FAD/NAD(P)-binding protein n=1 Tax=Salinimonas marina TaxID=2785918 RepID=A0A7S9DZZ1_9ALTE|nr:FAD/NAD(P)-binding protein [Salinimonas marina]QPG07035.1 FAD/NAD(P)-binding protein [Salinimonas marina]